MKSMLFWDCPSCKTDNCVNLSKKISPRTARVFYTCKSCSDVFPYHQVKRYMVKNWGLNP